MNRILISLRVSKIKIVKKKNDLKIIIYNNKMFNWFVSPKEEDEIKVSRIKIPKPPSANKELAEKIRRSKCKLVCYPDGFQQEIKEAAESFSFKIEQRKRLEEEKEEEEELQRKIKEEEEEIIASEKMKKYEENLTFFENLLQRKLQEHEEQQRKEEKEKEKEKQEFIEVEKLMIDLENIISNKVVEIKTSQSSQTPVFDDWESDTEEEIRDNKRFRKQNIEEFDWNKNISGSCDTNANYLDEYWSANPFHNITFGFDNTPYPPPPPPKENVVNELKEIVIETPKDFEKVEDTVKITKTIETTETIVSPYIAPHEEELKLKREHPEGFLGITIGPMFSGKTSKNLFKLSSMADQRFRCVYINSYKDVRETESYDNIVSTHNSSYNKLSPKIASFKVRRLSEVDVDQYDYIFVDELQFFDDAYENIINWVTTKGKYVLVASLDGDCYRRKFGCVLDLIPYANKVKKMRAYCDICRDNYGTLISAPFTARMTNDTSAELVGGKDIYKAMCRNCIDFHLDVTVNV